MIAASCSTPTSRRSAGRACAAVVAACAALLAGRPALAQLIPERTYYGLDRPMPMRVLVPEPVAADSSDDDGVRPRIEIQLLEPISARALATAAVVVGSRGETGRAAGQVDLQQLFADLWRPERLRPRGAEEAPLAPLMYAQLLVGGDKVGPAVVLQPMVSPMYAPRVDRAGAPMFPPARERAPVFSGYRAYVDQDVELETTAGVMRLRLRPDAAPNTCWRFRELVAGGLYTDVLVHRIASLAGKPAADIIQTGDPNGTGQGGCGEFIDLEPSTLPHDFGVVSMARFADVNSASSQFMIGLNREGTAYLDRRYTSFAVLVSGAEVLRAIAATPVGPDNRPKSEKPPMIRSARLVDAPPYGQGPEPARDPLLRNGR
jgi:cyclophilin family peptidyl-prolyl cis-trans isomerase